MEFWFVLAVLSAVFSGVSSFYNKVAVQRGYSGELLMLYSALTTTILTAPFIMLHAGFSGFSWELFSISFMGGAIGAAAGLSKIRALQCIDVTIFLPLFKMLSPLIVIVFSIIFFSESFSTTEWIGLIVSLLVPLLLITKIENGRQKNLALGLVYILLGSILSAIVAAVNKYSVDTFSSVLWILQSVSIGVFSGGLVSFIIKHRTEDIFLRLREATSRGFLYACFWRGATILASFACATYALVYGGPLGIVYTITSLYILLPIVLSIVYYNEHWNTQKIVAIILSILALALLN